MQPTREVLAISYEDDSHLAPVLCELEELGTDFTVIDRGDFPESQISFLCASDSSPIITLNGYLITDSTSIWWRRPRPIAASLAQSRTELDEDTYMYLRNSAATQFEWVAGSTNGFWVNHPLHNRRAENKCLQQALARQCDLRIPDTLYSNDPHLVSEFFKSHDQVLTKVPSGKDFVLENGRELAMIPAKKAHIEHFHKDSVSWFPAYLQEYIEKVHELRITIVGKQVFSCGIHSQNDPRSEVDWRVCYEDLEYFQADVADDVISKLLRLHGLLGLQYSASDLIFTADREYVFLELNPNGQYLWLDHVFSGEISRSLAGLLSKGDSQ